MLQHNHRGYWGASSGKIKNNRHCAVDFNYKGGALEMVMGSIPTGEEVTGSCILWNPDAPANPEQKGRSVFPLLLSHYTTFRPPLLALKFVSLVRKLYLIQCCNQIVPTRS